MHTCVRACVHTCVRVCVVPDASSGRAPTRNPRQCDNSMAQLGAFKLAKGRHTLESSARPSTPHAGAYSSNNATHLSASYWQKVATTFDTETAA